MHMHVLSRDFVGARTLRPIEAEIRRSSSTLPWVLPNGAPQPCPTPTAFSTTPRKPPASKGEGAVGAYRGGLIARDAEGATRGYGEDADQGKGLANRLDGLHAVYFRHD